MKVFRRKKNKEGCEKVERREGVRGREDEKEIRTGGEKERKEGIERCGAKGWKEAKLENRKLRP